MVSIKNSEVGFTLIELMIAVAIIGILAASAIPFYGDYVVKSQINRVVGEISGYKSAFENQVSRSGTVQNADISYVPSSLTTGSAAVDVAVVSGDGSGHMQVTMGGNAHPNITGVIVRIQRTPAGDWDCIIDSSAAGRWRDAYLPKSCDEI